MGMKLPPIAGPKLSGDLETATFRAIKDDGCEVCDGSADVVVIRDTVTETPANAVPLCHAHAGTTENGGNAGR